MDVFIEQRKLTDVYKQLLSSIDGVTLFTEPAYCQSNYWLQTLLLDKTTNRDEVLAFLNEHGVMSRPIWQPMHMLDMYKDCPRMDLAMTESLKQRVVNIPSTPIKYE